ncbi:MAG: tRNA uridine-5-carboxymethylaminomethyl(34) synthesis GTPase MnmE [Betaproteobacteria bacterium]|nr:MAG: tRNA uridine-5-carboxymethylaminomethyl(34) synthesis GTPase MnmE [Betaproteobacteria bacterium]
MPATAHTIVAVATPSGRGGVGIVRVSGSLVAEIAGALCARALTPRLATHTQFFDSDRNPLDDGIALHFKAPASFTGEDVLELHAHGSPMVLQAIVRRCVELGAIHAEPGEFTKRAYLNGKLDLAQAEAVADVIDAATESAARAAVRSLTGEFSKRIAALQDTLIRLRMFVEATLDFPEEDVEFIEQERASGQLALTRAALEAVLAQAAQGQLLHDGIRIVLAGAPNVGKSSLLNALAGEDLAIVTPIAGTTRDTVRSRISLNGLPVEIIDTAGLRATDDAVEKIGIERTRAAIRDADLALMIVDATALDAAQSLAELSAELPDSLRRIVVKNKSDLLPNVGAVPPRSLAKQPPIAVEPLLPVEEITVSAKTGVGLDALRNAIAAAVGFDQATEGTFSARERHVNAIKRALSHIDSAQQHLTHIALELIAEELRLSHEALGEITGEFTADDLLGEIFSRFCIGK